MGSKIHELRPIYCVEIPHFLEYGVLYISKEYKVAIHLCACGCDQKTVTPLHPERGWSIEEVDGKVTLRPSIGNFLGEDPYHAHYYITQNKIHWI